MVDFIVYFFAFIGFIGTIVATYQLKQEGVSFRDMWAMEPEKEEQPLKPFQFHQPRKLDI